MTTKKWLSTHAGELSGKTVALFGATGGLGQALARHILSLDGRLLMIDRNAAKAAAAETQLRSEFPYAAIERRQADLADFSSVRALVDALLLAPPDAIIHNAGAYAVPRYLAETGYENVFEINYAAPYYITRRLLPAMRERGGRVVAVSSIAHDYAKSDSGDPDFRTRKKASLVYGNAKRRLTYSLFALREKYPDLHLAVTHPGISATGITAHYPLLLYALIKHPMKWIFMKPRRAALSILAGLFEDTAPGEWIGPSLFSVWGTPKKRRLTTADAEEAQAIAAFSEELYRERQ